MKIKEQIIKDVCKKFPIEKIEGFDSEEVKALLFIISQRDVYMLNEAIESYEKEIIEEVNKTFTKIKDKLLWDDPNGKYITDEWVELISKIKGGDKSQEQIDYENGDADDYR